MPSHQIKTLTLELHCVSEQTAQRCHRQLEQQILARIKPALAALFETLDTGVGVLSVTRLEIDVGRLTLANLDEQILEKAVPQVGLKLHSLAEQARHTALYSSDLSGTQHRHSRQRDFNQATKQYAESDANIGEQGKAGLSRYAVTSGSTDKTDIASQFQHRATHHFAALEHYLTQGSLPWHSNGQTPQTLLSTILAEHRKALGDWLQTQLSRAPANNRSVSRLFALLTSEQSRQLIATLPQSAALAREQAKCLRDWHRSELFGAAGAVLPANLLAQVAWHVVLAEHLESRLAAKRDHTHRRGWLREHYPQLFGLSGGNKPSPALVEPVPEHYLQNSGLIILWPLLANCLKSLSWYDPNANILHQKAQVVCFLHYLTTGELPETEHLLTLPKLLSDYPLSSPLHCQISNEAMQQTAHLWQSEAMRMLTAVLQYLRPRRSAPPPFDKAAADTQAQQQGVQWLRALLLQREGKLNYRHGRWELDIAPQAMDMLLAKLPWPLTIIKLPWMPQALQVNWNP